MMIRRCALLTVVGGAVLTLATLAGAHHGAAGLFDVTRTVEVKGSVKMWSFVNPHPVLVLEVTDQNNGNADWDIYFGPAAASALQRRGYAADTFTFGETLIVRGHPAKAAGVRGIDVFGRAGSVTREDGTHVP